MENSSNIDRSPAYPRIRKMKLEDSKNKFIIVCHDFFDSFLEYR